MDKYSDEDLRKELKGYGQDVGPINNTIRPYWKKSLLKLKLQHGKASAIQSALKNRFENKENSIENWNNARSYKSLDCAQYTDRSFSEKEFSSTSENESFLTDSPGSTPFPIKPQHKKSATSKESNSKFMNKNNSLSMTPKSRKIQVNYFNNKCMQTRQKDKEIGKKLKEFGDLMQKGPLNETMRNIRKKRLNKLIATLSPIRDSSDIINIEEFKDNDSEKEDQCSQEFITPKEQFYGCLKSFSSFLLKGVVYIIIVTAGFLLLMKNSEPEDV